MMRKMILILVLFLLPVASWADEYVLVMSKEDNVCRHMLKLYNEDLKKYGKVKYGKHKEFNWINWEEKQIRLRPPSYPQSTMDLNDAKIALFDINNDSKNEVIVYSESMLSSNITYDYDIFRYDDLAMLDEVVDGSKYYTKALKSLSSADGVPVNIYDLSEADIKKLPERMKYYLSKTKERGDKYSHFVGAGNKINFLKLNSRFYIYFEETKDRSYHGDAGQYSIISELQKDNTLKNQCLYLINKDKSTNRRTR